MNKTVIPVSGMHCRSCELLIEDNLCKISGVDKAVVDYKKGSAEIYYEGEVKVDEVANAVESAGYKIGIKEKLPLFSKNLDDYGEVLMALITIFLLYLLADTLGLTKLLKVGVGKPSSLVTVLIIGLTAGFSTCMALVGGLVLGASARFAEKNQNINTLERFKPHIVFNIGRIISYVLFGGLIGMIGSFFQLSGSMLGSLTVGVAVVMLMLGLQLTGLFPRISSAGITLPKGLSKFLGIKKHSEKEYSHKSSFILGAATFFLPCGFTQAMQLYAMSSGSFASGALIMGTFALGTAPALLGIGGLTSVVKGGASRQLFKFAGVVVFLMAVFNLQNGLNLLGINPIYALSSPANSINNTSVTVENGVQIVKMTQSGTGYEPNTFNIAKGVPVKWIINSINPNSCASAIISSDLNIRKKLNDGENILEFTPERIGQIRFSCSMGMFTGVFNVVEDINIAQALPVPTSAPRKTGGCGGGCGGGGGVGCGGSLAKGTKVSGEAKIENTPTSLPENNNIDNTVQVISTTYTRRSDIIPNEFTVKAGIPVRMEIDVKDNGGGCMATIMIPRLVDDPRFLAQGKKIIFNFTPSQKGEFPITCAMGVPRGLIKVI